MFGRRFSAILTSVSLSVGFLVVAAYAFKADPTPQAKAVFDAKCAGCHGKDLKADTSVGKMIGVPDLTHTPWKNGSTEGDVEKAIEEGPGKMPAYKDKLTEPEIEALAKYVRTLAGVDKPAKKQ